MADKIDDGGPAFAAGAANEFKRWTQEGMSLRDWFAGQAVPALLAELYGHSVRSGKQYEASVYTMGANAAYEVADAMIAARKGGL